MASQVEIEYIQQRNAALKGKPLSARQAEVYSYLIAGHENKSIARAMSISVSTVEHHRETIYRKLGVHSLYELLEQHRISTQRTDGAAASTPNGSDVSNLTIASS